MVAAYHSNVTRARVENHAAFFRQVKNAASAQFLSSLFPRGPKNIRNIGHSANAHVQAHPSCSFVTNTGDGGAVAAECYTAFRCRTLLISLNHVCCPRKLVALSANFYNNKSCLRVYRTDSSSPLHRLFIFLDRCRRLEGLVVPRGVRWRLANWFRKRSRARLTTLESSGTERSVILALRFECIEKRG